MQSNKITLMRWCIWFCLGNVILFWIIGYGYLSTIPWLDMTYFNGQSKTVIKMFAALSYIGHFGLLAMLPCVFLIPLSFLLPKRQVIFTVAILIATAAIFSLFIDVNTFKIYRFHLNNAILDLAINGLNESVWDLSWVEYFLLFGLIGGVIFAEFLYALCIWHYILPKKFFQQRTLWISSVLFTSLFISYSMIVYSSGHVMNRVLVDISRYLPLYTEILGTILPTQKGNVLLNKISAHPFPPLPKTNTPLHYPLTSTQCTPITKPKNLVMIVIDAWRFDQLTADVTPTLAELANTSWVFKNHFSGGNATGPGIFSLFYGLPLSYWTAVETQHKGPLLLDELIQHHYQMGIFCSATLKLPPFNRTVFSGIKNLLLVTPGSTPYQRDKTITNEFKTFLATAAQHPNQPFFSFLFYDAAHGYCAYPEDLTPRQPSIQNCNHMNLTNQTDPLPYLNRYKNALLLVDQQIKIVLDSLRAHHMLENTVVLITGDHGEEFNDNHLNYWGHASNFTHYQTQTPLIIHWPNETPKIITHQTSHFDIAPTLIDKVLACHNPSDQLSVGKQLLDPSRRPYLIIGSYTGYAIIEPSQITNISSTGNLRLEQLNGQPSPDAKLNLPLLQQVFHDLGRFYS